MIYYFSGIGTDARTRLLLRYPQAAILYTYAYLDRIVAFRQLARGMRRRVLIDSGAFSAWSRGAEVDREDLARVFAEVLADGHDARLINLDVIPGEKGRDPTAAEVLEAMRKSEDNYAWLDARFPRLVLPVFHQGEPLSYLRELESLTDYVCLSPRNDVAERYRLAWIEQSQNSTTRYHGLATTGHRMMVTGRWESVDSATWMIWAAYGCVMAPRADGGWWQLSVSDKGDRRKKHGAHINTLPARDQEAAREFIARTGFTAEQLRDDEYARLEANLRFVLDKLTTLEPRPLYSGSMFA